MVGCCQVPKCRMPCFMCGASCNRTLDKHFIRLADDNPAHLCCQHDLAGLLLQVVIEVALRDLGQVFWSQVHVRWEIHVASSLHGRYKKGAIGSSRTNRSSDQLHLTKSP